MSELNDELLIKKFKEVYAKVYAEVLGDKDYYAMRWNERKELSRRALPKALKALPQLEGFYVAALNRGKIRKGSKLADLLPEQQFGVRIMQAMGVVTKGILRKREALRLNGQQPDYTIVGGRRVALAGGYQPNTYASVARNLNLVPEPNTTTADPGIPLSHNRRGYNRTPKPSMQERYYVASKMGYVPSDPIAEVLLGCSRSYPQDLRQLFGNEFKYEPVTNGYVVTVKRSEKDLKIEAIQAQVEKLVKELDELKGEG